MRALQSENIDISKEWPSDEYMKSQKVTTKTEKVKFILFVFVFCLVFHPLLQFLINKIVLLFTHRK